MSNKIWQWKNMIGKWLDFSNEISQEIEDDYGIGVYDWTTQPGLLFFIDKTKGIVEVPEKNLKFELRKKPKASKPKAPSAQLFEYIIKPDGMTLLELKNCVEWLIKKNWWNQTKWLDEMNISNPPDKLKVYLNNGGRYFYIDDIDQRYGKVREWHIQQNYKKITSKPSKPWIALSNNVVVSQSAAPSSSSKTSPPAASSSSKTSPPAASSYTLIVMGISTHRRGLSWSDIKFLENVDIFIQREQYLGGSNDYKDKIFLGNYNIPVNSILHLNVMYKLSNLELWLEDGSKEILCSNCNTFDKFYITFEKGKEYQLINKSLMVD